MNIESLVEAKTNPKIPQIVPGDTVKVSAKIVEGGKERIQVFQGVVIRVKRGGNGANFTVRHVAQGIGVERTFLFHSPLVEKVEIVRHGKVRRSKLYYLRGLSGKEARRKVKRVDIIKKQGVEPEIAEIGVEPEPEAEPVLMEQEQEPESTETTAELEPEAEDTATTEEQTPEDKPVTMEQEEEPENIETTTEQEEDSGKEA